MSPEALAALFEVAFGKAPRPDAYVALFAAELIVTVDDGDKAAVKRVLTERGRAFVEYLCTIQLPEATTTWSIPGAKQTPRVRRRKPAASPVVAVAPRPLTPEEKRVSAVQLTNAGWGRSEIAKRLEMTEAEVDQATGLKT